MLAELLENGSVIDIVATFVALALVIAAILSLVYVIVGGISFILSAGNEEKIKNAMNTIRFSIIGLVVAFIAFFLVSFVANLLGIPFEISFSTIIDLMGEIFNALQ